MVRPSRPGRCLRPPADAKSARLQQAPRQGGTHARNIRRALLALGITLIVLPAAISDGHKLTPHQAQVLHQAR